ncbi:MAG: outer membrane beta-barrel protein [Myxococcota bacterium]
MKRQHPIWLVVPSVVALTAALPPRPAMAQPSPEAPADATTEPTPEQPEAATASEPTPSPSPSVAAETADPPPAAEATASATIEPTDTGAETSASVTTDDETSAEASADEATEPDAAVTDSTDTEDAGEAEPKWTDNFSIGAFADAYFSLNTNFPRPQGGNNVLRAFDGANGFSLAWAGLNTAYEGERAAATIDLRFGTGPNAGWADDSIPGIQHVKQAFGTWHALPDGKLSFDFGRFDTIYGAEVAESWQNHNYTRGGLYNLAQPFWHTGLRVSSQLTDKLGITGMLVNGWGHIVDNNTAKSLGLQLGFTPSDVFGLYVGYLGGAESDDVDAETGAEIEGANWDLRHLADVVMTVNVKKFSLAFNADYIFDDTPTGTQQWAGAMLSAGYQALPWMGIAARGEYLFDPDGFMSGVESNNLATGTLTLDFLPADMVTLRLEGRGDGSTTAIFPTGSAPPSTDPDMPGTPDLRQYQFTVTLGMVVHSF